MGCWTQKNVITWLQSIYNFEPIPTAIHILLVVRQDSRHFMKSKMGFVWITLPVEADAQSEKAWVIQQNWRTSRKVLSSLCSTGDKGYTLEDLGFKPGRSPIVWSQWWCSGRMSKSSLVNTALNPWMQLDSGLWVAWTSALQQAPSARYWEVVAVAWSFSTGGFSSNCIINNLSPSSQPCPLVLVRNSSLLASFASMGNSPFWQVFTVWTSCLFCIACSFCIVQHPSHQGRQRVISTSPLCQSTSGLWSLSQGYPSIRSCFPRLETMKNIRSKWVLYQSTTSMTLEICPASLGLPFILNMDIGYEILWVLIPLSWTKSLSMKLPVALQSRSALLEWCYW